MNTIAAQPIAVVEARSQPGTVVWLPVAIAAVALAFGIVLRWWRLGAQSLWFDEGYTAWVVSLRPAEIVRAIRADTAPPLYYLLLRGWVAIVGTSEAAMRAPSAACATAALGIAVAIVLRQFRDPWARAVGVAAVACSFMQVAYAHEVRFYAMMSLLGALDYYLVLRACERNRRARGWLVAAAVAWAVSLWLNNIMAVYLACLGYAWLVVPGRRPLRGRLADIAVVAAVAGLAFAPWVESVLAQTRAVRANFWSHRPAWADLPRMLELIAGANGTGGAVVLVSAAVACGVATVVGKRWGLAGGIALYGLLPVVVTFAYSRLATSVFMDRAFIVSSGIVPLLAAVPLEVAAGGRARRGAAVLAGLLLVMMAQSAVADRLSVPDHVEDWRAACRYAARSDRWFPPGHRLTVFNANEGELLYDYYARGGDFAAAADLTGTPADFFAADPPRTLRRVRTDADLDGLRHLLDRRPIDRLVLVSAHAPYADADGRTLALLRARMRQVDARAFDAVTVYRFAAR